MKRIPKQFYIFVLALGLFFLPVSFLFSNDNQRYVLPVYITFQLLFVISCNKITQATWATLIIIIEAICMLWNTLLFVFWNDASIVLYDAHSWVMFFAFALEILVLNLSMIGGQDGRNRKITYNADFSLLRNCYSFGGENCCEKVAK